MGTLLAIVLVAVSAILRWPALLLAVPLAGYGFAWVGHFVFERNRPATFQYPVYSLIGDFVLFRDILIGRVPF